MVSNRENAQACGRVQNMLDNLRTQRTQFIEQQNTAKQVHSP